MAQTTAEEIIKLFQHLTGQPVPLTSAVPDSAIELLRTDRPGGIGYSQFNELLLFLGYDRISHPFFQYLVDGSLDYKTGSSIETTSDFSAGVDRFRKLAMLRFGNVKYAFKRLSRDPEFLEEQLALLEQREASSFRQRHEQVLPPEAIEGKDTYYLGYVIQAEIAARLKGNPQDAAAQREEAKRKSLVEKGARNHSAYLVSDHLDVYVATSMRERHEYLMVYETARAIFRHSYLARLKLRFFDPTQAYCLDRIDKGLAEALMLKRAKCTIYFAQESETLGKDSELASTLAQGKPVIAFVAKPDKTAAESLVARMLEVSETQDACQAICKQLRAVDPDAAWGDKEVRQWLDDPKSFDRAAGIKKLQISMEKQYEKRDRLLREIHPLGIQVNLSTGVANGVLVVNTIEQCAKLVRSIVLRELEFDLETKSVDDREYLLLRERISNSIFRVVTGDAMLTNAFWNFYLDTSDA